MCIVSRRFDDRATDTFDWLSLYGQKNILLTQRTRKQSHTQQVEYITILTLTINRQIHFTIKKIIRNVYIRKQFF